MLSERILRRVLTAAEPLETLAKRSEKVVEQMRKRLAGEPITDRLVSLFHPDARPIRKGKLGIDRRQRRKGEAQRTATSPNTTTRLNRRLSGK